MDTIQPFSGLQSLMSLIARFRRRVLFCYGGDDYLATPFARAGLMPADEYHSTPSRLDHGGVIYTVDSETWEYHNRHAQDQRNITIGYPWCGNVLSSNMPCSMQILMSYLSLDFWRFGGYRCFLPPLFFSDAWPDWSTWPELQWYIDHFESDLYKWDNYPVALPDGTIKHLHDYYDPRDYNSGKVFYEAKAYFAALNSIADKLQHIAMIPSENQIDTGFAWERAIATDMYSGQYSTIRCSNPLPTTDIHWRIYHYTGQWTKLTLAEEGDGNPWLSSVPVPTGDHDMAMIVASLANPTEV